ncbi:S-adenosyl-L-methionine-dependent methyltransferase [Leptodontidium sp. MPI-SDFR-AT-0119]|nr:S-adenosyl-L-methionine-dependent methyltransferase [Leptodontidium sp. MPI-SDFR-AT-0119]
MSTQHSSPGGSKSLESPSSQGPPKTTPSSPPHSPRSPLENPPRSVTASPVTEAAQAPPLESGSSPIEVGDGLEPTEEDFEIESDADTGYGDDGSSIDASLSSSVKAGVIENGLRYHGFRRDRTYYPFPNDENEQNRDDMKHAIMGILMSGKLHFAPIGENPQSILDLGTGSGIWAIEMGDKYPSAQVQGIDLSPIQPPFVPPNVKFVIDDIEDDWLYPLDHFDYIHCRHVTQTIKNRPRLMDQAFKHTKPGGYLEFQEVVFYTFCDDDSMTDPYPFRVFMDNLNVGLAKLGGDNLNALKLADEMRQAGFVDVQDVALKIPLGVWPKSKEFKLAGLYWRENISDGIKSIANRAFISGLGWSVEALEVFLVDVRKSLYDASKHVYFPLRIITGRKPLESE